jgi:serine/threonine-protein kinase ULK/ATG1
MEYCSMGDLAGFIRHGADRYGLRGPAGGLSEHVIRHFLRQLASALRFMHVRNLIHRDIKPQNLLLLPSKKAKHARMALNHNEQNVKSNPTTSPQSQESVTEVLSELPDLKVADFGMARVLGAQEQAETACGTWAYAAPEVMMCKKYDGKADLWSVGVVLYEMCYGRLPFTGQNHPELLRQIHEHADDLEFPDERDLRFPGAARTAISDDLKDLIRQLLRPNPEHRISFTNFFRHPCVVGRPPIVPESSKYDKQGAPADIHAYPLVI